MRAFGQYSPPGPGVQRARGPRTALIGTMAQCREPREANVMSASLAVPAEQHIAAPGGARAVYPGRKPTRRHERKWEKGGGDVFRFH